MDFETFYKNSDMTPGLHDYINMAAIKNPQDFVDENGDWNIEDVLWAPRLYRAYPWLARNVTVNFARSNHRNLRGEVMRIITLGGGEGTIYINLDAYDDMINAKDKAEQQQLVYGIIHEIGHAVDDHDGNLEYSTEEEKQRAERFATDFANKWSK